MITFYVLMLTFKGLFKLVWKLLSISIDNTFNRLLNSKNMFKEL